MRTNGMPNETTAFASSHRQKKTWLTVLAVLAVLVVFATVAALTMPASAMTAPATPETAATGETAATPATSETAVTPAPTDGAARMLDAAVYADSGMEEELSDAAIQIAGQLPEGVTATAWPVEAEVEDQTVLAAYEITLWLNGEEYEPESPVEVKITAPELEDVEKINVYHIDDATDETIDPQPELVTDSVAVSENNEVTFDADRFSTYVLTAGDDGVATLATYTLDMKVGETQVGYRNNYIESYYDWGWKYSSSSDTDVATLQINSGRATITAVGPGGATVTIYYRSGGSYRSDTYNVTVSAANGPYTVTYVVDSDKESIGKNTDRPSGYNYPANSQEWVDTVTVTGLTGLEEDIGTETDTSVAYTVKDVSSETRVARDDYVSSNKGDMLFTYTFLYWEGSDGKIYHPGDEITLTGNLELTAKWCVHFNDNHNDENFNSVAFYVAIASNLGSATGVSDYTDAVFTTSIKSDATNSNSETAADVASQNRPLYGSDDRTDYIVHDQEIRNSGAFTEFPSDDEIFDRIRTWSDRADSSYTTTITINGRTYRAEEITADNFDIYWFVVKSNTGDTWHVDGMLMPKEAKLTVTKTFVGNEDAIAAVQQGYSITVTANDNSHDSYDLQLNDTDSEDNVELHHEEGSNTYTWVLTGLKQLTEYTVKESDYRADGYTVTPSYQITQSRDTDVNTQGWQTYNDRTGITVEKCYGYQDNVEYTAYQTVSLRNVYTEPFIMTILKQDGTTLNGLDGVSFILTVRNEDNEVKVDNATVTTNANGQIEVDFEQLGEGTYTFTLEEQPYEGYQALATISGTVTVDDGGMVTVSNVNATIEGDNTLISVDEVNPSIVYIENISERTQVAVNKVWTDGTNKQVTMQLVRNGTDVTGMTQVLDSSNSWTYTWTNLPLYVDGEPADYTVRETWIGEPGAEGSSSYTAADDPTDGYADYIVTMSKTQDESGNTTITVTNTRDNGQVVFTKVDENNQALAGATFTVYTDDTCETVAQINGTDAVFTSDENGFVTIVGLAPGTYYVKETQAPDGYEVSDAVYTLNAQANNSTLTLDGESVTTVVNQRKLADITIHKVDGDRNDLTGAEFVLTNESGQYYTAIGWIDTETILTPNTDDGSKFTITGLADGTYTLTETKAPDGYQMLTEAIKITVQNGYVSCSGGYTPDDNNIIAIANTTGVELPATGGTGTTFLTCGGLLLMAAAVGGYAMRRRRGKGAR